MIIWRQWRRAGRALILPFSDFSVEKNTRKKEELISESVWAGRPCDLPDDIPASVERAGRALAFQHDSLAPATCDM